MGNAIDLGASLREGMRRWEARQEAARRPVECQEGWQAVVACEVECADADA
jgi:hypothetical protein